MIKEILEKIVNEVKKEKYSIDNNIITTSILFNANQVFTYSNKKIFEYIQKNDKCVLLCYINEPASAFIQNQYKASYINFKNFVDNSNFDYILALEFDDNILHSSYTFSKLITPDGELDTIRKDNFNKRFYRFDEPNENKFYSTFIKIPKYNQQNSEETYIEVDNEYYDIENLLTYLTISDSRTYKQVIDKTPVFKSDADDNIELKNVDWPHNILVHGAPGTVKSYMINEKAKECFIANNINRVTFYEDYSYEKFIGAYMPVQKNKTTTFSYAGNEGSSDTEAIAYEFKPGIFAEVLAEAYIDLLSKFYSDNIQLMETEVDISKFLETEVDKKHLIIIEEINRAPAASVFGDFFQLLDRDENGVSNYHINISDDFKNWFVGRITNAVAEPTKNVIRNAEIIASNLKLPPNLYIWATMNSADQGVFPLDSAFKRRWSYMYKSALENRTDDKKIKIKYNNNITEISWDKFRHAINNVMENNFIEEDKFIGPYYFNETEFNAVNSYTEEPDSISRMQMFNPLCDKLITYLRNDVFRNNPEAVFEKNYISISKIREAMNGGISLEKILKLDFSKIAESNFVQSNIQQSDTDNSYNEAQA